MTTPVVGAAVGRYSGPYDIVVDYRRGRRVSVTQQHRTSSVDAGLSRHRPGLRAHLAP